MDSGNEIETCLANKHFLFDRVFRKEKPQAIYRSLLCSLLSLEALDGSVLAVFATLDKGK